MDHFKYLCFRQWLRMLSIVFMLCPVAYSLHATHIRGGFINAELIDNNSLTYHISLAALSDAGSTVLFGGGMMDFGDGSEPQYFEPGKPDYYKLLDEEVILNVYDVTHSFPGPGEYIIGYREFNRNASIANMDNSVNTAFYIETKIVIDPFLGANSSAKILNYFPFKNKLNHPYIFPLNAIDPDGDSISMETAVPLQDKGVPVKNYVVPTNFEGNRILSQMQLHVPANEIVWANPLEEDEYNFAVKIMEWRFNPPEERWINIGYTVYDFQVIISEKFDQPPDILEFRDTAILASMDYSCFFTIRDDNSENIRVRINENIPGMNEFQTDIDEELYYPAPFQGNFSVFPSENLSRPYPYKVVISADPKENRSAAVQKSSLLWITEHSGFPAAPGGLNKVLAFRNTIILGWQDLSDNEAGFVVERADSFFPEFIRIAALPANTMEYTDNNVIPNRDYYYRVKSIGTGGSSTSEVLEIREMDIITEMNELPEAELLVYPNPVDDQLVIVFRNRQRLPSALEVIDIAGKTIYRYHQPEWAGDEMSITIPATGLSPGIYFLVFDQDRSSTIRKFVKR